MDFWKLSSPTPLFKREPTGEGFSGLCPVKFWVSPRLETPQHLWAICSSIWWLYFNLHSLPLLSLGTTEKGLLSLSPFIRYLQTLFRHYWTFSPSCWTVTALSASVCQMLQTFNHLCGPSLSLLQNTNVSLLLACPGIGIALQMWSQTVIVQGMDCFSLLGNALPHAAQEAAGCTCHIHHLSTWLRWGSLLACSFTYTPFLKTGLTFTFF